MPPAPQRGLYGRIVDDPVTPDHADGEAGQVQLMARQGFGVLGHRPTSRAQPARRHPSAMPATTACTCSWSRGPTNVSSCAPRCVSTRR